ncbi:MAG: hypothetical protein IT345_11750 [Trueperaceae bacterium]|nr:hypothetical protein [Trueperaceae bacterium]
MDAPYATVADLRAEGVEPASVPDARAQELILLASRFIDRLTGQRFFPRHEALRLDGDGSAIAHHPALLPILEIRRLAVNGRLLGPAEYAVRERYVELVRGAFPAGRANVELDGVFGWLEARPKVATELAEALVAGATEATLADAAGLRPKDALLVGDELPLLVASLAGATVTGEPVPAGAPAGALVVAYGRVPRPVERACLMLAVRHRHGLATDAGARAAVNDRIIEERTDNYLYRLAAPQAAGGDERTSGDLAVDRLLADYVAPPFVGVV